MIKKIACVARGVGMVVAAWIVSAVIISLLLLLYSVTPIHVENIKGNTDYVWKPNSIWIKATEGIAFGQYDAQGFNNKNVVENPDVLVLGSSHMEATNVLQTENAAYILGELLKEKYSIYNMGISGHHFYKVCQYLPKNMSLFSKAPKYVVIETSAVSVSEKNIDDIKNKKVKHTKSYDTGIIGALQKVPYFRLVYLQSSKGLLKIFVPDRKKKKSVQNKDDEIDQKPYHQLFEYLKNIEKEYGTQIIIAYHPTGKIQKDGSIEFKPSERKKLFNQISKEYEITFVDLTDDFEKMFYEEHHVAHGFVTGKIGSGHLNRYGHECMAKAVYKTIKELEKEN